MTEKILRFRWLIIAVMVLAFAPKTVQAQTTIEPVVEPSSGNGSPDNPYQIANEGNLYWFANEVNNNSKTNICAVLTEDITVNKNILDADGNLNSGNTNFYEWTPIGISNRYTGTFNGQGHTVSGLYFNNEIKSNSLVNFGLFGSIGSEGSIKNVGVEDSYFNVTVTKNNDYGEPPLLQVGGVCGYTYEGTITNCHNAGTVSGTAPYVRIGGVCGNIDTKTITNCYNTGNINGTGDNTRVGGVCGNNYEGTISNCYNTGTISGTGNNVGGVCGYNNKTITNCYYLTDENDSPKGIGYSSSYATENKIEGKSLTEFGNGSVAWLLNGNSLENNNTTGESDWNWYQALGSDNEPVLKKTGNNTIYVAKKCTTGEIYEWSNSKTTVELTDHVFANKILSKKSDTDTDNLYSYVCENCHIARSTKIKIIKNLTKEDDDDITIERDDEKAPWKTEAKITLGDDPAKNRYNAPVEFTTTGEVSYKRTMSDKNRWATVCLPYEISISNYTDKCKFYELSGVDESKITLTEITETATIAAGTPVFVKVNEGVIEITFSATGETKMLTAPTTGSTAGDYTLTGAFELTTLPQNSGDIFIKNDKMWDVSQVADKEMKVKIFRAYLKNNGSVKTGAPQRSIAVDGEATAISDALDTLNDANAEYYDMSGRRINALQKGVNIIRSGNKTRKVIIK